MQCTDSVTRRKSQRCPDRARRRDPNKQAYHCRSYRLQIWRNRYSFHTDRPQECPCIRQWSTDRLRYTDWRRRRAQYLCFVLGCVRSRLHRRKCRLCTDCHRRNLGLAQRGICCPSRHLPSCTDRCPHTAHPRPTLCECTHFLPSDRTDPACSHRRRRNCRRRPHRWFARKDPVLCTDFRRCTLDRRCRARAGSPFWGCKSPLYTRHRRRSPNPCPQRKCLWHHRYRPTCKIHWLCRASWTGPALFRNP